MGSVYSLSGAAALGESWSNDTPSPRAGSTGVNTTTVNTPPPPDDSKDVSAIPAFSKVEELKGSNPTEFQQVVTDAVTKLKVAAKQTSDPFAASFLWNLANRFQLALDTGDSLPLQEVVPGNPGSGPETP
jgi:hypothetical protein